MSLELPHHRFMAATIRFARRHMGLTAPNPCVGAIVVRSDNDTPYVVGRGVTAIGGRPHAEARALQEAGCQAQGATLYVTMEPCSHYGLTPPCAEQIIACKIAQVVMPMRDPDLRVAGQGLKALEEAGIRVITGIRAQEARFEHISHICWQQFKRPYIFLKLAVSADGLIGRKNHEQVSITGEEAWHYTQLLRAMSDVIMVGAGTVLSDNPRLTCRLPGLSHRAPGRVILQGQRPLPKDAYVFQNDSGGNTTVLQSLVPEEIVSKLASQNVRSVMIEGGAEVATSFLEAGLIDAVHLMRAPNRIGGPGIRAPLHLLQDSELFTCIEQRQLGADWLTLLLRKDF